MGAFEAIAMIGTSYVLISLYRALSHIERRYQAVWHGSKKYRRIGCAKPAKKPRLQRRKSANTRRNRQRTGAVFAKKGDTAVLTRGRENRAERSCSQQKSIK